MHKNTEKNLKELELELDDKKNKLYKLQSELECCNNPYKDYKDKPTIKDIKKTYEEIEYDHVGTYENHIGSTVFDSGFTMQELQLSLKEEFRSLQEEYDMENAELYLEIGCDMYSEDKRIVLDVYAKMKDEDLFYERELEKKMNLYIKSHSKYIKFEEENSKKREYLEKSINSLNNEINTLWIKKDNLANSLQEQKDRELYEELKKRFEGE